MFCGDLNESRLSILRSMSKSRSPLPPRCITLVHEHDMSIGRPMMVICNGKIYDVAKDPRMLPNEKRVMEEALARQKAEWEQEASLENLFGLE